MAHPDIAALRTKLADFSRRLQTRTAEFEHQGVFADVHGEMLRQMQHRRDRLMGDVLRAERTGTVWDAVKAALARDFNSISDDLLSLEGRLSAEMMKRRKN